jgi:hypothetical protein
MRLSLVITLAAFLAVGIRAGNIQPEEVKSIIKDRRSNDWYLAQAEIWKKRAEANPKDDQAWRNYYFAVRYADFPKEGRLAIDKDKKSALAGITEKMMKSAPNACNTYLVRLYETPLENADLNLAREAVKVCPGSMELLEQSVYVFEICGARDEMKTACKKLYRAGLIENCLLDFNYNLLVSSDSNALLFTNGDNDTYPLWILQKALGIREDVTVLNRALLFKNRKYCLDNLRARNIDLRPEELPQTQNPTEYLAKLSVLIKNRNSSLPVYFSTTVLDLETMKNNLFNVGLASAYSTTAIDNIALLRRNFETRYRLDNLYLDWREDTKTDAIRMADLNYIYPLLALMRHYKTVGETGKVARYRELLAHILEKTGNHKTLPLLKEFE